MDKEKDWSIMVFDKNVCKLRDMNFKMIGVWYGDGECFLVNMVNWVDMEGNFFL